MSWVLRWSEFIGKLKFSMWEKPAFAIIKVRASNEDLNGFILLLWKFDFKRNGCQVWDGIEHFDSIFRAVFTEEEKEKQMKLWTSNLISMLPFPITNSLINMDLSIDLYFLRWKNRIYYFCCILRFVFIAEKMRKWFSQ